MRRAGALAQSTADPASVARSGHGSRYGTLNQACHGVRARSLDAKIPAPNHRVAVELAAVTGPAHGVSLPARETPGDLDAARGRNVRADLGRVRGGGDLHAGSGDEGSNVEGDLRRARRCGPDTSRPGRGTPRPALRTRCDHRSCGGGGGLRGLLPRAARCSPGRVVGVGPPDPPPSRSCPPIPMSIDEVSATRVGSLRYRGEGSAGQARTGRRRSAVTQFRPPPRRHSRLTGGAQKRPCENPGACSCCWYS